ncbi:galactose ABC transporter substrate-binding protein [Anaerofilum sp. BX8]|uniref:D-galactose/methyl-galactoside binding periplasmic protein MglB n=1 Tax=Anaerofilum hominis TaxID=2763016 RepID=A0A923REK8_9FIRM|nr:galactose ABC transporter substrate-binding protein [Anaerofilum hominis]MBC5582346.1 galactose ABC transporter substrate-binding protein [Anaerofilum hominis]
MKKALSLVLAFAMALSLVACGGSDSSSAAAGGSSAAASGSGAAASGEQPVAGVCWYNFGDTFIANARNTLNEAAAADGTIKVIDADSQNDVATQTSNMNNFYTQGVDYLVLNNINNNAIAEIIERGKEEDVTLIFANTNSPTDEEFAMYDKVYHVSSVATQSGTIMGEALVKYWNEHPEMDRNGNGKLDYIMLLGIQGHYDTEVRSSYSLQALADAGIETECVQETICNYQRADAQNQVASILQARKDDVDAVIACNDDMALGAIEALKAAGFFADEDSYIPVVGVDATANGVEAIKDGTLLCTALNNPVILGNSVYKLMTLLNEGKELTQENLGMDGVTVEGHHININYIGITADNVEDAAY